MSFDTAHTDSNLDTNDLSYVIQKLDNISHYLNILMHEINEIKKSTKTNTQHSSQPVSFTTCKNNAIPYYYKKENSQYDLDPDIIFK